MNRCIHRFKQNFEKNLVDGGEINALVLLTEIILMVSQSGRWCDNVTLQYYCNVILYSIMVKTNVVCRIWKRVHNKILQNLFLQDSTWKSKFYVAEITFSISDIPVNTISSFEGNMPELSMLYVWNHLVNCTQYSSLV